LALQYEQPLIGYLHKEYDFLDILIQSGLLPISYLKDEFLKTAKVPPALSHYKDISIQIKTDTIVGKSMRILQASMRNAALKLL